MGLKTFNNPLGTHVRPYSKNQIIFETSIPQELTIELPTGLYQVACIGAGGGGSGSWSGVAMGSGGGSGSYIVAQVNLYHGLYRCKIGNGGAKNLGEYTQTGNKGETSDIFNIVDNEYVLIAHGGSGATRPNPPGTAGTLSINDKYITKMEVISNGEAGQYGDGWTPGRGGTSVAGGFGQGGNGGGNDAENGTSGYFKLTYLGEV